MWNDKAQFVENPWQRFWDSQSMNTHWIHRSICQSAIDKYRQNTTKVHYVVLCTHLEEVYHALHRPGRVVKNLGTFWVWEDFALPWKRYILLPTALEDLKHNLVLSDFVNTLCCPRRDASSFSPPWKSGKQIGYFLTLKDCTARQIVPQIWRLIAH